ncbi:hypothetical protein [Azoarcus sp. CIB]|uniref:hypothetical protein n=1 Tax=Aromatoleum sp. (strain CIB) TaxID=198107 RepID=UPI00067C8E05|nr:hypothetical protein [Azoarcus sp. CIB]
MTLPVVFLMIVLKKSAVRHHFPGGEAGFRARYPYAAEDRYLFGLGSMSGQDLEEYLAELRAAGIDTQRCCAIADRHGGVIAQHPDIMFERSGPVDFPGLEARLVRDDPLEMAREGESIVRWLMARGFEFDVPAQYNTVQEKHR